MRTSSWVPAPALKRVYDNLNFFRKRVVLRPQEISNSPEIIRRLYHQEDVRVFEPRPVAFRCSCSHERVTSMLRMLGHDEVRSILEERGNVEVDCEFCGRHYVFDAVDAEQVFAADVILPAEKTRH